MQSYYVYFDEIELQTLPKQLGAQIQSEKNSRSLIISKKHPENKVGCAKFAMRK